MSNFTWPVDKREKGNRIRVHLLIRQFLRKGKTEFVKIKKNITMIYLLWALINLALSLYFLSICIKAIKLVRQELGLFATVIFVIGLLSFCGRNNDKNKDTNSNQTKNWTFTSNDSLHQDISSFLKVKLQDNLISKYEITIDYGKDKNNINIPISAFPSTTGFIAGTEWKAVSISVYKTNDNTKFQYYVAGYVEWNLLGINVYTQNKIFKGTVSTEKPCEKI